MHYGNTPQDVAVELANTFEEHALYFGGIAHLSPTGWELMSEKFGNVDEVMRASVYNDFTKELTKRGIDYAVEDFQHKPEGEQL